MNTTGFRFRFELTPLSEIEPWGDDKPTLHWYGLTDGLFWIEAGDTQLFRYRDAINAHWSKQHPQAKFSVHENYQVARYFEDLLDLLPTVLTPLPDDLAQKVKNVYGWREWSRHAQEWQNASPEERYDLYYEAMKWWHRRQWGASHLAYPPDIWLWRESETVHIRWDNRARIVDGIPVWTARQGEVTVSVAEFIVAVRAFNDVLLVAMSERVRDVMAGSLTPRIVIDLAGLQKTQTYMATLIDSHLSYSEQDVDWNETRSAIRRIHTAMRAKHDVI